LEERRNEEMKGRIENRGSIKKKFNRCSRIKNKRLLNWDEQCVGKFSQKSLAQR